jgi:F420-0:gamma-glutamyl ligase
MTLASAAGLAMGEAAEAVPAVLLRLPLDGPLRLRAGADP